MSDEVVAYDPYALPNDAIKDPPESLWLALKQIGPGIILAGTIVGSGELILTTAIGAKHGFVFLWLILFSCVIKVFVQIELGRYAISSGKPTLGALQSVSRYRWFGNLLLCWWFTMMVFTVFQLGGMTGGVGQSMHMAFPQLASTAAATAYHLSSNAGDYLSSRGEFPWAIIACLVTIALIFNGSYRRIEGITTVLVVGVTLITFMAMLALAWTPYSPSFATIAAGFEFKIPQDGIADAFAVFGITGVGATELFYYPYWCLEKGYARYVGVNDGSLEWERRARGWVRVMHLDAWVSMVVFTLSTIAFYFMGAAVLHPQNLVPEKEEMIATLSKMYIGPFGQWTQAFFLIGAGAVLFKTLYLACAANSRMTVDFLNLIGLAHLQTPQARAKRIRVFCFIFPLVALGFYWFQRNPQLMVQIGGMAQAATLPMMASVTLYFRYFKVDKRLQPTRLTDLLLWIATVAILVVAAYAVPDALLKFTHFLRQ